MFNRTTLIAVAATIAAAFAIVPCLAQKSHAQASEQNRTNQRTPGSFSEKLVRDNASGNKAKERRPSIRRQSHAIKENYAKRYGEFQSQALN